MTMLDGMRRHKGWLKWSLALVVLAFVFLYVPQFMGDSAGGIQAPSPTVLARVGNHEISTMQFRRAYLQQLNNYRLQSGGDISEELLRQLGVDRQILQQMISEYTALTHAENLGLAVTDAEVRQKIITTPGFQENGQFIGEQRYTQLLQSQNVPPAAYEEDVRRQILIERLQSAITQWVDVSDEEIADEYRRRNEKVRVDVVAFRGDEFRDDVEVADADVEALYDQESAAYQVSEKRKLKFLLIDESALADGITPTDAEVQDQYDFNISQYSTEGQVRARHILLRIDEQDEAEVEARAMDLATQALNGADFGELAREHSDDSATAAQGGDLGMFARGRMVAEFEAVAFELDVDEISDPVKSQFGFHVIQVTEKQEASVQPLADVRTEIERTLKRELATTRSAALSNAIAAEAQTPAELEAAASSRGLEVRESGFASLGEPLLGLGMAPEVSSTAFQLEVDQIAGPIPTPLGPAFISVSEIQDPYVPALDEVRAQVREDVIRRKSLTLARERANEAATLLKSAEDFVAAAEEADLTVSSSGLLARGAAFPEVGINAAVETTAFELAEGGVSDVIEAGNTAAILHVVETQGVMPGALESAREDLRLELLQQKQQQFFQSYMAKIASDITVTIDQTALNEALGV